MTPLLSAQCLSIINQESIHVMNRDVGIISNLGARHFKGIFSLRKRGHFPNIKMALLCSLQNLRGHMPQVPPGSYLYGDEFAILFIGSSYGPDPRVEFFIGFSCGLDPCDEFALLFIGSTGRKVIADAIADYHKYSCLRFYPRRNEGAYLYFTTGSG